MDEQLLFNQISTQFCRGSYLGLSFSASLTSLIHLHKYAYIHKPGHWKWSIPWTRRYNHSKSEKPVFWCLWNKQTETSDIVRPSQQNFLRNESGVRKAIFIDRLGRLQELQVNREISHLVQYYMLVNNAYYIKSQLRCASVPKLLVNFAKSPSRQPRTRMSWLITQIMEQFVNKKTTYNRIQDGATETVVVTRPSRIC